MAYKITEDPKPCTCNNDTRYCKGCYVDVTKNMFCICGGFPLKLVDTISKTDMVNLGKS